MLCHSIEPYPMNSDTYHPVSRYFMAQFLERKRLFLQTK
jgi:hypothetical protein